MTDVITISLSAYGESGTIADKIDPAFRDYMTAKDGKYYMVPFYDGFYGFIYDVDLFEEEGYYFDEFGDTIRLKDGKKATEAQRTEFEAQKSKGPDNVKGTYDDGLPATYDQFIELCDIISAKNIPFCYSGSYDDYVSKACRAFIADYEGYEGFSMNYTFSGEAELVKTINADGTLEMETVTITEDNAYELQRQAGKYYALDMQEKLFGSVKYIGNIYNSFDFTTAQAEFIKSKYGTKRYAMLLDGIWWENEANSVFTELETIRGESKSDRRFAFMPMPKATAAVGDEARPQTMFSANSSFGFISKNAANMELAKEFMRFLHTDAEMSKFSAMTSIPRALNYEVKEEDMANATNFGKSLLEMRMNASVVYPYSSLSLVINNSAAFTEEMRFLTASVGGATLNNPFTAFKNGTATAAEYFNGLYAYQKNAWNNLRR
jgi:ABC-type glycerol-3-phosphate transport system substrate-binding protein